MSNETDDEAGDKLKALIFGNWPTRRALAVEKRANTHLRSTHTSGSMSLFVRWRARNTTIVVPLVCASFIGF